MAPTLPLPAPSYMMDKKLITNDKDFGELIFRIRKPHKSVILLRLKDERPKNKIAVLQHVSESYSGRLANNFVIATEETVRIIREKTGKPSSNGP